MVDTKSIYDSLIRQLDFYKTIVHNSSIPGDVNRAKYGIEQTEGLIDLVEKIKTDFSKAVLKQIESKLTNLTRGVEYFEDYQTEIKNRELGDTIYEIQKKIGKVIDETK